MNDFYKKSLSELLYETNDDNIITTKNLQNEQFVYKKGVASLLSEIATLDDQNYDNVLSILKDESDIFLKISDKKRKGNYVKIINADSNKPYVLFFNSNTLKVFDNDNLFKSAFEKIDIKNIETFDKTEREMEIYLRTLNTKLKQGQISFNEKLLTDEDQKLVIQEIIKKSLGIGENPEQSKESQEGSSDSGGEEGESPEESQGAKDKAKELFNNHFAESKIQKTTGPDNIRLNYVKLETGNKECDYIIYDEQQQSYYIFKFAFEGDSSNQVQKFVKSSESKIFAEIEKFVKSHSNATITHESLNLNDLRGPGGMQNTIKAQYNKLISEFKSDKDQGVSADEPDAGGENQGQESGDTSGSQESQETSDIESYFDQGNILYFVHKEKKSSTLLFDFYKKENDKTLNYILKLNRDFQSSNTPQVKHWDAIKDKPFDKGKPSLINKLYQDTSQHGYKIEQINQPTITYSENSNLPIGDLIQLSGVASEKVLEFSKANQDNIVKFYKAVVEHFKKSQTQGESQPEEESADTSADSSATEQGTEEQSDDQGTSAQGQEGEETEGDGDESSTEQGEDENILQKAQEHLEKFIIPRINKTFGSISEIEESTLNKLFIFANNKNNIENKDNTIKVYNNGERVVIGDEDLNLNNNTLKAIKNKIKKKCLDYYSKNKKKFPYTDNNVDFTNNLLSSMIKNNINFLEESYLYKNSLSTLLFEASTSFDDLEKEGFLIDTFLSGLFNYIAYDNLDHIEDAESDTATMASRTLAARIKRTQGISDKSEITEDQIRLIIGQDLQRIVVGTIRSYDEERYNDLMSKSKKIKIDQERTDQATAEEKALSQGNFGIKGLVGSAIGAAGVGGALAFGTSLATGGIGAAVIGTGVLAAKTEKGRRLKSAIGKLFSSRDTDQQIEDRINDADPTAFETAGSQYIKDQINKELNTLIDILLAIVKEDKDMLENKNLFVGSISKLLFEADEKEEVTLDLIKDYLRSSGILFYEQGQKGEQLRDLENRLANTLAAMLRTHFNVKVKNANSSNTIDTKTSEVESMVDKDAKKGQPASQDIAQGFAGMPIPTNMDAAGSIDQLAMLANISGGNMMFMFMMMMMNQNFMQMMMQMQQEGASLKDMSKKVAEESEELSDFDKEIEYALKEKRASLPDLGKSEVKKLFKLVNDKPFRKIKYCNDALGFDSNLKDQRTFVSTLKQYVNISDKKMQYDKVTHKQVCKMLNQSYKIDESQREPQHDVDFAYMNPYAIEVIVDEILDVDESKNFNMDLFNNLTDIKFKEGEKEKYVEETDSTDDDKEAVTLKDAFKEEIETQIAATKQEARNLAEKYLKESAKRYNHPVLRRRVPKKKIINESEFLKKEFKRLWKL